MSVDDSVIDDDHKVLIDLVNAIEGAVNKKLTVAALDRSLMLLKHYALEHFKREEALQRAVHYPFYQAHACEHRDLVKRLEAIIAHRGAAQSGYEITVVAREILDLLKEWLIEHILHTDLRMRPYVAQMRPYRQRMTTLGECRGGGRPSAA
jgi:hemerythrin